MLSSAAQALEREPDAVEAPYGYYTNIAGHVVCGRPVVVDTSRIRFRPSDGGELVFPASAFSENELRRLAVDSGSPLLPPDLLRQMELFKERLVRIDMTVNTGRLDRDEAARRKRGVLVSWRKLVSDRTDLLPGERGFALGLIQ